VQVIGPRRRLGTAPTCCRSPRPLQGRRPRPAGRAAAAGARGRSRGARVGQTVASSGPGPHRPRETARHVLKRAPRMGGTARGRARDDAADATPSAEAHARRGRVSCRPAHPGVGARGSPATSASCSRATRSTGVHLDYIRQPRGLRIGKRSHDPRRASRWRRAWNPATFGRLPRGAARADGLRLGPRSRWSRSRRSCARSAGVIGDVRPGLPPERRGRGRHGHGAGGQAPAVEPLGARRAAPIAAYLMCYAPGIQTVLSQLSTMRDQLGTDRFGAGPSPTFQHAVCRWRAAKIKAAACAGVLHRRAVFLRFAVRSVRAAGSSCGAVTSMSATHRRSNREPHDPEGENHRRQREAPQTSPIIAHVDHGKTTLVDRHAVAKRRIPREESGGRGAGSWTRTTSSARRASRSSPKKHLDPLRRHQDQCRGQRRATLTSAARWSARSRWWTACCCSWTRARGPAAADAFRAAQGARN